METRRPQVKNICYHVGVVKYRFIQVKSTTTEKRDWNMEQVSGGSSRFFLLHIRVKKEGKKNRNLFKKLIKAKV